MILFDLKKRMYKMGNGSGGGSSGGYGGMYGSSENDPLNDPAWKTNAEIANDSNSWTNTQKQGEAEAKARQQAAYEAAKAQGEAQAREAAAKAQAEAEAEAETEETQEEVSHPLLDLVDKWLSNLANSTNLLTSTIGQLAQKLAAKIRDNIDNGRPETEGLTEEEKTLIQEHSGYTYTPDGTNEQTGESAEEYETRTNNQANTSTENTVGKSYQDLYNDYAKKIEDYATKQKQNIDNYTNKNNQAVSDYQTNVKNAADNYNTTSETNVKNYKTAMDAANKKYEDTTTAANKEYNAAVDQYTGNKGYQNSVDVAKKTTQSLASAQANQAANAQRTAMRNAGQSSNAAAILAGNNVVNTYQKAYTDNFNTQQQQVASQGQANVQGKQQNVNNVQTTAQNVLNTTTQKEANALNVLQDTAKTNLNTLTAAEQNALSQKTATALEELSQNKDLLNTEVEYQGKLISMKSAIEQYQRLVSQWQIALEQYNAEKDATKKAEIWTNISNILSSVKSFWSIFDSGSSETGSSYTKEGLQLVGEAGPEIVELPEGSKVVPASVTKVVIKSENPKEMIDKFFEAHNLKNEVALDSDYNPASDCINKIDMFIKKNKKKDWSKLKEAGSCDKDYKDCMKSLDELFKNN